MPNENCIIKSSCGGRCVVSAQVIVQSWGRPIRGTCTRLQARPSPDQHQTRTVPNRKMKIVPGTATSRRTPPRRQILENLRGTASNLNGTAMIRFLGSFSSLYQTRGRTSHNWNRITATRNLRIIRRMRRVAAVVKLGRAGALVRRHLLGVPGHARPGRADYPLIVIFKNIIATVLQ
jgi:hypothetical protein